MSYVHELHCEQGLRLVKYGGGSDFRESENLVHYMSSNMTSEDVIRKEVENDVITEVERAYAARGQEDNDTMPLPSFGDIEWDSLTWDLAVNISSNVRVGTTNNVCQGGAQQLRCNLFHQGWLLAKDAQQGVSGKISYPLLSVIDTDDSGCFSEDPGDNDLLGTIPSVSFLSNGGVMKCADQHIHKVDPWGGGTMEEYCVLLMQTGMTREEADSIAAAEKCYENDYYLGADMARILVTHVDDVAFCTSLIICIDLHRPDSPQILLTLLVVALNPEAEYAGSELKHLSNQEKSNSGGNVSWNTLEKHLQRTLDVGGASVGVHRHLTKFKSFFGKTER